MKRILFFLFFVLPAYLAIGQPLSGTFSIPNDYPTIADAITALNANGVGAGGVIFNVETDYTETTSSQLTITATGISTNPIVFQRDGAGANPKITRTDAGATTVATLGYLSDAIIRLDGTDYITFDGIDIASNNSGIDYGYMTHKPSATNGCQYVTIKNCNITMTKGTSGVVTGIYISNGPSSTSATGVTVTANSGRNENITITGNSISNVHAGIVARGSSATNYGDNNLVIGQIGAGNIITNYGGGIATSTYGVYMIYQQSSNVSYNSINNASGGSNHTSTLYGIFNSTLGTGTTSVCVYNNNNITLGISSTSGAHCINDAIATTSKTIANNTFSYGTFASTSTSYMITASSATNNLTITGNQTSGTISKTGASGAFYGYYNAGSPTGGTETVTNNNFSNITVSGTSTFTAFLSTTSATQNKQFSGNTTSNILLGTGTFYGINSTYGLTANIYNNNINTVSSSGTIYGIQSGGTSSVTHNTYSNTIYGLTTAGTSSVIYGINASTATTNNLYNNKIYNLTGSVAGSVVHGLYVTSGTTISVYNNFIYDLKTPNATGTNAVNGLNISGGTTVNAYFNSIFLNATSTSATTFGTSGIYASVTPTVDLRNNIVLNNSTPVGTSYSVAYRRSAAGTVPASTYSVNSNKNCFFVSSGTNQGVYVEGTSTYTNYKEAFADYKTFMATRDQGSYNEEPPFMEASTTPYDLHINPSVATQLESGGITISGITTDIDGNTRDASTPDVGADEGIFTPQDLSAPTIIYTALPHTILTTGVTLTATITDASGVPTSGPGLPNLYWTTVAANSYQAVEGTWVSGNTYTFDFAAGVASGDVINYYIVAQDNASNVGAFPSAGAAGFTTDPPVCSTPPTTPSTFNILYTLNGTFTVGTGGDYATLTAAANDYNAKQIVGPVVFELLDASYSTAETFPITFNQNIGANATNTLTISPASGVASVITGSTLTGIALIKFNGADYITFDGLNTGGSSLTVENTSTAASTAVFWVSSLGNAQGAVGNSFKNMTIKAGSNSVTSTFGIFAGGTSISTTGTGSDNDDLTIQGNTFNKAYFAIYARGNASPNLLDNLNISNNIIGSSLATDYILFRGIDIQNALVPTVSGNEIFNLQLATLFDNAAIDLGANVTDAVISKNKIWGLRSTSTSGYGTWGINISATTTSNILITNNRIYDLLTDGDGTSSQYNPFGIRITGGTNHKIYNNSINLTGSFTNATTADISAAIVITSSSVTGLDIRNNIFANSIIGGTGTKSYSIYAASGVVFTNINNNVYYTSGANSVFAYFGADKATFADWKASSLKDNFSFNTDPQFTSSTDLHINSGLSQSYLESTGATLAAVTTDFDGDARPGPAGSTNGGGTAYDIGADEFDGVPYPAMTYTSSTLTQSNIAYVLPSSTNNQIIGFEVVTSGVLNPLELTQFSLDLTGTAVAGTDFTNAKIFFTGTSSTFATTMQYGTTIATPTASFSVAGTQFLSGGANYFWLTFDVPATGATNAATLDISCSAIKIAGIDQVPTINDPAGSRSILTSLAGTYTVGNGGNFVKLSDVFTAANNLGLSGNVTLNVISNITETATCTLNQWTETGVGNYTFTINPIGNDTISGSIAGALIKLSGADRVTIDGLNTGGNSLTLQNKSTSASAVIWLASAQDANLSCTNVSIKNTGLIAGFVSGTTAIYGIHVGGATINTTTTGVQGFDNDNLTIQGNSISNVYYGIYIKGNGAPNQIDNLQIKNNNISTLGLGGIMCYYANSPVVQGNTINSSIANTNTKYGVLISNSTNDLQVSKNNIFISGATMHGISLSQDTSTALNSGYIWNNFISLQNGTGLCYGIRDFQSHFNNLFSNSINISGSNATDTRGINVAIGSTNIKVINNNVLSNKFPVFYEDSYGSSSVVESNYNNFYSTGTGNQYAYYTTAYQYFATLADMVAAPGYNGKDANSISIDPIFVSTTNLHTFNSALYGLGTEITYVTDDIDGDARPNPPCIGADEFVPLALDMSATALVAPAVSSVSCYSNAETVTVTIKNLGTATIDFGVNPTTVTTNVSGAATSALSALVNSGTLAPNATLNVDMSSTLDMTATGIYTFNASISVTGDGYAGNDAMPAVTRTKTALSAGAITGSPLTLCFSGTPTFTLSGNTGGNIQWQESTLSNSGPWTNVGTNASTYAPGTVTAMTYYQAVLSCYTDNVTTNNLTVTVNAPAVASTTPASICGSGTVTLGATASSGTLNWYAAASGGTSLGSGETFTTPSLTSTTSYYVSAELNSTSDLGRLTHVAGTGTNLSTYGQVFTITSNTVLNSVNVISTTGTSITISLYNSGGTSQLQTTGARAVTAGTEATINLGWTIAPGTYRLMANGMTGNFIRENSNVTYPIALTDLGTINGFVSSLTGSVTTSSSYYFMYRWNMNKICMSPRQEVVATVIPATVGGSVYGSHTICSNNTPSSLIYLSGNVGNVLKWQKSDDLAFTNPIDITNTNTSLTGVEIGILNSTTYFRAHVQSGSCTDAFSSAATITVDAAPVAGSVSGGSTITLGQSTGTLSLNGQSGNIIKWQVQIDGAGYNDISASAGLTSYSETPLALGTYEYRAVIDNGVCADVYSVPATVIVNPVTIPTSSTWTGLVDNDWNKNANWNNGKPVATAEAIIPATAPFFPTLTAPVTINKLTVESNASGTGSLLDNGNLTITGSATIKQYVEGEKWHLISSPVQNVLSSVFDLPSGQADIYVRQFNGGVWTYITNLTTPIVTNKGYGIWADCITNSTPNPTISFTGQLNNGNQTFSLTPNSWELIGNPYISSIDWSTVTDRTTNLLNGGAIYFWKQITDTTGVYATHDGTIGTNGATQHIPAMQGFFVKAATNSLNLTNLNRSQIHTNQSIYKSSLVNDLVRITAKRGNFTDETVVLFNSNATNNYDEFYDASKMFSSFINIPEIYTLSDNNNLVFNRFGTYPAAIPMNIRLGVSDNVTLTASEFANFDANVSIKLEDLLLGTTQDLRLNPSYTFAASIGDNANRFVLHFATATGINENNGGNTSIYAYDNTIYVNTTEQVKEINIYNMLGQVITSVAGNGKSLNTIKVDKATAYYVVKVTTDKGVRTEKVFVK
jgi:hypothetical protein